MLLIRIKDRRNLAAYKGNEMPRQSEYSANQQLKSSVRPYTPRPVKQIMGVGYVAKMFFLVVIAAAVVGFWPQILGLVNVVL